MQWQIAESQGFLTSSLTLLYTKVCRVYLICNSMGINVVIDFPVDNGDLLECTCHLQIKQINMGTLRRFESFLFAYLKLKHKSTYNWKF